MLRLYFLTFYGEFRGTTEQEHHLHESPRTMTIPLWVLAFLSAIGGLLNVPHLFGGNQFLSHWLEPVLNGSVHELDLSAATEGTLMGVTTLIILGILFWSYNYYVKRKKLALTDEQLSGWRLAASNKLYIDEIYDNTVVSPFMFSAKVADDYVEKGLINRLAEGIGSFFKSLADTLRRTQDGNLEIYLLGMVAGIILLLLFNSQYQRLQNIFAHFFITIQQQDENNEIWRYLRGQTRTHEGSIPIDHSRSGKQDRSTQCIEWYYQ